MTEVETKNLAAKRADLLAKRAQLDAEFAQLEQDTKIHEVKIYEKLAKENWAKVEKLAKETEAVDMWVQKASSEIDFECRWKLKLVKSQVDSLPILASNLAKFKDMKGTMDEKLTHFRALLTDDIFAKIKSQFDDRVAHGRRIKVLGHDCEKVGFEIRLITSPVAFLFSTNKQYMELVPNEKDEKDPKWDTFFGRLYKAMSKTTNLDAEAKMALSPIDASVSIVEKAIYWVNMIKYLVRVKDPKDSTVIVSALKLESFISEASTFEEKHARWFISDQLYALFKEETEFFNTTSMQVELFDFVPDKIQFSVRVTKTS